MLRFWLIDVPAFIVTIWFRLYWLFLSVLALTMFGLIAYTLLCLAMDWPVPGVFDRPPAPPQALPPVHTS